jgi:hypothetical protein
VNTADLDMADQHGKKPKEPDFPKRIGVLVGQIQDLSDDLFANDHNPKYVEHLEKAIFHIEQALDGFRAQIEKKRAVKDNSRTI